MEWARCVGQRGCAYCVVIDAGSAPRGSIANGIHYVKPRIPSGVTRTLAHPGVLATARNAKGPIGTRPIGPSGCDALGQRRRASAAAATFG